MEESFKCDLCKFETDKLFNYDRHLKSKRHQKRSTPKIGVVTPTIGVETPKIGVKKIHNECEYCGRVLSQQCHLTRHYTICKDRDKVMVEQSKDAIIHSLQNQINENQKLLKDKEHSAEEKNKIINKLLEVVTNTYNSTNSTINSNSNNNNNNNNKTINNNVNINYNLNYIKKNYNEAHNYEDLMSPALTKKEIAYVHAYGPSAGCEKLIIDRCIKGIDQDKRPIHCVDQSREKFLVRTDSEWQTDTNGTEILKPAFAHMRTLYDISDNNTDIIDRVNGMKLLMDMDMKGGKKTIKNLMKQSLLKDQKKIKQKKIKAKTNHITV